LGPKAVRRLKGCIGSSGSPSTPTSRAYFRRASRAVLALWRKSRMAVFWKTQSGRSPYQLEVALLTPCTQMRLREDQMRALNIAVATLALSGASIALAANSPRDLNATLEGYQEVQTLSTAGTE